MRFHPRFPGKVSCGILIILFGVPSVVPAQTTVTNSLRTVPLTVPGDASGPQQTQVVSLADIHQELVGVTQTRQRNREKVSQLFSSQSAQNALRSARIDPEQIQAAVSTLSDAELARLASRADKVREDFAAGRISDRDLLIILVGIAVIILIIVAVR